MTVEEKMIEECGEAKSSPVKIKKKLGLGLITASLFFLFNPDIIVLDLIPDAIGYILMCLGLSQLSLLNETLSDALSRFKKMIWVSVGRFASLIFIFGLSDATNQPYSFLLFSFSFLILDLIFLVPAYKYLFAGILELSGRHGGTVAYFRKNGRGLSYAEKTSMLSVIFVIVKSASATLPEFISLVTTEYTDSFVMYLYDYVYIFRTMGMIISLVFGIVWLCKTSKFFVELKKEEPFLEELRVSLEDNIISREGIFIRRTLKTVIAVLMVGAVFCIDFHVGSVNIISRSSTEVNIIPDAVAALLFAVAAYMLRYYIKDYKRTLISSLIYMAVSIVGSAMKLYFIAKFDYYTAVNKVDEAYYLFNAMCAVTIIENIMFIVTVVMLSLMLKEVIKKYTGYAAYEGGLNSERITALQKDLTGKLKYMIIFAVIGAATAVAYEFMLPEKHIVAQYMWVFDFILQGIFSVMVRRCLFAISDEVENRFILE